MTLIRRIIEGVRDRLPVSRRAVRAMIHADHHAHEQDQERRRMAIALELQANDDALTARASGIVIPSFWTKGARQ